MSPFDDLVSKITPLQSGATVAKKPAPAPAKPPVVPQPPPDFKNITKAVTSQDLEEAKRTLENCVKDCEQAYLQKVRADEQAQLEKCKKTFEKLQTLANEKNNVLAKGTDDYKANVAKIMEDWEREKQAILDELNANDCMFTNCNGGGVIEAGPLMCKIENPYIRVDMLPAGMAEGYNGPYIKYYPREVDWAELSCMKKPRHDNMKQDTSRYQRVVRPSMVARSPLMDRVGPFMGDRMRDPMVGDRMRDPMVGRVMRDRGLGRMF